MSNSQQVVIKKYANRRLYNTNTSSYITLEDLGNIIKSGKDFIVYDAKTHKDITRSVLTQIILDHETKGYNLLPIDFLKQIIRFYDSEFSHIFNSYLSMTMEYFNQNNTNSNEMVKMFSEGLKPVQSIMDSVDKMFSQNNLWLDILKNNFSKNKK